MAIDEVIAFPNAPYDDHVDALTNFLELAADLDLGDHPPPTGTASPPIAVAVASRPSSYRNQVDGIGYLSCSLRFVSPVHNPFFASEIVGFGSLKVKRYS
jgi:hypothetical protein